VALAVQGTRASGPDKEQGAALARTEAGSASSGSLARCDSCAAAIPAVAFEDTEELGPVLQLTPDSPSEGADSGGEEGVEAAREEAPESTALPAASSLADTLCMLKLSSAFGSRPREGHWLCGRKEHLGDEIRGDRVASLPLDELQDGESDGVGAEHWARGSPKKREPG
jgi:hypothetical protein